MTESALLAELLSRYGYLAVLVGTFLEGETVLVLAGTLAHEGYFRLPLVALCAFVGSVASDQLLFHLGRRYGAEFLASHPRLRRDAERVNRLLGKHDTAFILGFRFVYGIRSIAPALMGIQGIAPGRFLALNLLGALLWAVLFSVAGYFIGSALEQMFGNMEHQHHLTLVVLLTVVLAAALIRFLLRWRSRKVGAI